MNKFIWILLFLSTNSMTPEPIQRSIDFDRDSLNDSLEDQLAQSFFPQLWFDSGEDCTAPASASQPGTVLARVRPHPDDPDRIAITYVTLYREDCGGIFGITKHPGDLEPFAITLAVNPSCPKGYGIVQAKSVAHAGTATETVDRLPINNICSWGPIYAAKNKHGVYFSLVSCDAGGLWGSDHCGQSFSLPWLVHNAGEPNAIRLDDLSGVGFPGEFAWQDQNFCGGQGRISDCPGAIREKLDSEVFLAPAH
jgi:hypothetical protein